MSIRDLAILAVITLLAGYSAMWREARSGEFNEANFPPEVRKSLRYAHQECKREGGGKVTFALETVRVADLTGDGRPDYVVSLEDTVCEGRPSVYCGTGGCTLDILVTLPKGGQRLVFSDRVLKYEILPYEGTKNAAKTVRFRLHGAYCGKSGGTECVKTKEITVEPFEFKASKL
jgi:hypothetical protein